MGKTARDWAEEVYKEIFYGRNREKKIRAIESALTQYARPAVEALWFIKECFTDETNNIYSCADLTNQKAKQALTHYKEIENDTRT